MIYAKEKKVINTNTWMRRRKGNSNFIKSIYLKVEKSTLSRNFCSFDQCKYLLYHFGK